MASISGPSGGSHDHGSRQSARHAPRLPNAPGPNDVPLPNNQGALLKRKPERLDFRVGFTRAKYRLGSNSKQACKRWVVLHWREFSDLKANELLLAERITIQYLLELRP